MSDQCWSMYATNLPQSLKRLLSSLSVKSGNVLATDFDEICTKFSNDDFGLLGLTSIAISDNKRTYD